RNPRERTPESNGENSQAHSRVNSRIIASKSSRDEPHNESVHLNESAWDAHYRRSKARQSYPDENLVRLLKSHPHRGPALDFGCGSGRHRLLFSELGFAPVYGLDSSQTSIEMAASQAPFARLQKVDLNSLAAGTFRLPFADASFDVLVAWGVLHYNPGAVAAALVREFYRVLRPAGLLAGTLRSDRDTHYHRNADISSSPIELYNEQQTRELLNAAFENFELGYMERTPVGELDRRIAHWIFRAVK
ncbi:MAG: class I SAM-dependent methyltransferase, partial [Leptospiraceae bacterium]|nr:class I SAM-dependent methyltransferase [Leptospiraceae bacterium]